MHIVAILALNHWACQEFTDYVTKNISGVFNGSQCIVCAPWSYCCECIEAGSMLYGEVDLPSLQYGHWFTLGLRVLVSLTPMVSITGGDWSVANTDLHYFLI